ncbi:MAG: PAS domain-containing protein, partial [Mariprofundaceae bacterium]|nr:PAS domain-containing protein [Mariprofundaceae bacterium]
MPELKLPYIRILMLLILIIGGCEYLLMTVFDFLHIETYMHDGAIAFLDAFCLIVLATPLAYVSIIRPLIQKSWNYQRKIDVLLSALDGASDCIMITNADGNVTYTNQAFTSMTGYSAEEILGKNPRI